MFDDTLICPHCHAEQLCHEPDDISANMCYTECEFCDKPFWYAVTVTRSYSSYIDDEHSEESGDFNE